MFEPAPSNTDWPNTTLAARKALRAASIIVLVYFLFLGSYAWADENEPLYYTYHGQPKALTLDAEHIAVRVRNGAASNGLPVSLTTRGFTSADVEARRYPIGSC